MLEGYSDLYYAPYEEYLDGHPYLKVHSFPYHTMYHAVVSFLFNNPCRVWWAGAYAEWLPGQPFRTYDVDSLALSKNKGVQIVPRQAMSMPSKYAVVNITKREFYIEATDEHYQLAHLPVFTSDNMIAAGETTRRTEPYAGIWTGDIIYTRDLTPSER